MSEIAGAILKYIQLKINRKAEKVNNAKQPNIGLTQPMKGPKASHKEEIYDI